MTAATPKPPTPQGISALLRKAGFEKSVSSTTRIKGWHSHSPGFVVRKGDTGDSVHVYYETGMLRNTDESRRYQAEMAARYAETVKTSGHAVELGGGSYHRPMIVTASSKEAITISTNFYVKPPGATDDMDTWVHLGKSSVGWAFTFRAYPDGAPPLAAWPVNDFASWRKLLLLGEIRDEYGHLVMREDLLTLIGNKRGGRDALYGSNFRDADGNRFVAEEFS